MSWDGFKTKNAIKRVRRDTIIDFEQSLRWGYTM